MAPDQNIDEARRLVQQGASDERIERLTGLSLTAIIGLRAAAATPLPELQPISLKLICEP